MEHTYELASKDATSLTHPFPLAPSSQVSPPALLGFDPQDPVDRALADRIRVRAKEGRGGPSAGHLAREVRSWSGILTAPVLPFPSPLKQLLPQATAGPVLLPLFFEHAGRASVVDALGAYAGVRVSSATLQQQLRLLLLPRPDVVYAVPLLAGGLEVVGKT